MRFLDCARNDKEGAQIDKPMQKCLIVAIGQNNEIGVKGALPWHISADLQYFKRITKGFPVIMGRTTYFSLPVRPLPGRKNIVLNLGGDPIEEVACVYSFEGRPAGDGPAVHHPCACGGSGGRCLFPGHRPANLGAGEYLGNLHGPGNRL